jgi:RimJ/RimL family protein N-acetyltransferase
MIGMSGPILFRTARLSGRAPYPGAAALYGALFGPDRGHARLSADLQDWTRHQVAPWVLFHADHPVGVAGFRIGFGETGLELSFHFLPDVAGQGLASEFVQAALDTVVADLREDRFFAFVSAENAASIRVLDKAGFVREREAKGEHLMRLALTPRPPASPKGQDG